MDEKGRDESKSRRREETLARRVGEALDQMNPSGLGECPEAEIIAAYADRGLTLDETAQWESHFATCARCRKVLRVLAASSDAPLADSEVERLGELVAARLPARAAEPPKIARPKARDWRGRWLAPALGVAAVLAVWFAMRPPWKTAGPSTSSTLVAQAPKELAPPMAGPTDQLSSRQQMEDKQALKNGSGQPNAESRALDSRNKIAAGGPSAQRDDLRRAIPNQAQDNALQKRAEFDRPANERGAPSQASPVVPQAPLPAPPPGNVGMATGAPATPQSNAKSAAAIASESAAAAEAVTSEVTNAPPPPPPAPKAQQVGGVGAGAGLGGAVQPEVSSRLAMNAQSKQAFGASKAKEQTPPLLAKSPTSDAVLWRAGTGGTIERSTDSGRSWHRQASPVPEDWLSGAAVSDTICWLAGRNGAIARTLDGEHWDRVPPPAQAAGTAGNLPDWIGIAARDAQSATVTASDGRRFVTSDGGKTWKAQQ